MDTEPNITAQTYKNLIQKIKSESKKNFYSHFANDSNRILLNNLQNDDNHLSTMVERNASYISELLKEGIDLSSLNYDVKPETSKALFDGVLTYIKTPLIFALEGFEKSRIENKDNKTLLANAACNVVEILINKNYDEKKRKNDLLKVDPELLSKWLDAAADIPEIYEYIYEALPFNQTDTGHLLCSETIKELTDTFGPEIAKKFFSTLFSTAIYLDEGAAFKVVDCLKDILNNNIDIKFNKKDKGKLFSCLHEAHGLYMDYEAHDGVKATSQGMIALEKGDLEDILEKEGYKNHLQIKL